MPLTPTPGSDAVLGGMTLVPGTGLAADLEEYINRAMDYIANGPMYWKSGVTCSIAKGGTGASTAPAARTALGIIPENIGAWKNSGAVSAGAAPTLGWDGSTLLAEVPGYAAPFQLARRSDIPTGTFVSKAGDTMSGFLTVNDHIYVPNSFAAVSGFTIAYINSDGRISKGASSERYKKYIRAIEPSELGDIFPQLHRFQMRSLDGTGDGAWHYGYIAERLDENDDQRVFVIYDQEGRPDSIDFIGLLLAQVAQLHQRERERDVWIEDLLNRVESLENAR